MKIMHLSDLHLGRRIKEFSMLEDQSFILREISDIADREEPDVIVIAGDVYDKAVPSAEAVQLFDHFLVENAEKSRKFLIISGNHDSPERIAFGGRLMETSGVFFSPVYDGEVTPVSLEDAYGSVNFYMLPFIKPVHVRRYFPEEETDSYTDAVRTAIRHMEIDPAARNVLITHQFVTGAQRSESEELSVGGADNVDVSVFRPFDYTALGHIHGPQNITDTVRYCGTPLKYSFSEAGQQKSVTITELGTKGSLNIRTVPLEPLHDMRVISGTYLEVTARDFYAGTDTDDYLQVTLKDEEDIPCAVSRLRAVYPNVMGLTYDNCRTRAGSVITEEVPAEKMPPLELFADFYRKQNNAPMTEEQRDFVADLIEKIGEEYR
mgnify:CR=1 FL=1